MFVNESLITFMPSILARDVNFRIFLNLTHLKFILLYKSVMLKCNFLIKCEDVII